MKPLDPKELVLEVVGHDEDTFSVPFIVSLIRRRLSRIGKWLPSERRLQVRVFSKEIADAVIDRLDPAREQPAVRFDWY